MNGSQMEAKIAKFLISANDPGASLQGYTRKKLFIEHGDVFFYLMPYK